MTSLVELFCDVDDFCQGFYSQWEHQQLGSGTKKRIRVGQLTLSEMMTIMIHFHQAQYRYFKAYYEEYVQVRLRGEFPKLVSYGRFVQLMHPSSAFVCVSSATLCADARRDVCGLHHFTGL